MRLGALVHEPWGQALYYWSTLKGRICGNHVFLFGSGIFTARLTFHQTNSSLGIERLPLYPRPLPMVFGHPSLAWHLPGGGKGCIDLMLDIAHLHLDASSNRLRW